MADSPILKIPLLSTSQSAKETTINTMVSYLERSMNDAQIINLTVGNVVITPTDFARFFMWRLTGVVSGRTVSIPASKRLFVVENLTGAFTVLLARGASTLTVPIGGVLVVYCDGTNIISVADSTTMGGGGGAVTAFVSLIDTFSSYAGEAGKVVRVNSTEDGLEPAFVKVSELEDVSLTGLADGYTLLWDETAALWVPGAASGTSSGGTSAIKIPVDAATELTHTLNDDIIIGSVIDGVTLMMDMRVLVKSQTLPATNGIYQVTSGDPIRAPDSNANGDFYEGTLVYVKNGVINGDKLFIQTEPDPPGGLTPGLSPLTFDTLSVGSLSSLNDVDVTAVTDGDALVWDSTISKWIPGAASASFPPMATNAGRVLAVNATEDGVEWAEGGSAAYPDMAGNAGKVLTVNDEEDGVEWGEGGAPVLSVFSSGVLGSSETLFRWVVPEGLTFTLPAGLTGSKFTSGVASDASATLTIYKNVSSIGTIVFNTSDTGTVTFVSGVTFIENDVLMVTGPASPDSTLADISLSFKGA